MTGDDIIMIRDRDDGAEIIYDCLTLLKTIVP